MAQSSLPPDRPPSLLLCFNDLAGRLQQLFPPAFLVPPRGKRLDHTGCAVLVA